MVRSSRSPPAGTSLADTFGEMEGHVAAGNGSLGYLIERGVVPHFCVVIDAMPHMAEIVVPDNGVYYLLDSGLFDKLLKADCKIRIWTRCRPTLASASMKLPSRCGRAARVFAC